MMDGGEEEEENNERLRDDDKMIGTTRDDATLWEPTAVRGDAGGDDIQRDDSSGQTHMKFPLLSE